MSPLLVLFPQVGSYNYCYIVFTFLSVAHHVPLLSIQDSFLQLQDLRILHPRCISLLHVLQNLICHNCLYCQGRQVEAKRLRESGSKLGDEGSPEMESHWQKVSEEKDAESKTRENKLQEQISDLKKKVTNCFK